MLSGVTNEILRLEYTIEACEIRNPYNLNIEFMKRCLKALQAYRDICLEPEVIDNATTSAV